MEVRLSSLRGKPVEPPQWLSNPNLRLSQEIKRCLARAPLRAIPDWENAITGHPSLFGVRIHFWPTNCGYTTRTRAQQRTMRHVSVATTSHCMPAWLLCNETHVTVSHVTHSLACCSSPYQPPSTRAMPTNFRSEGGAYRLKAFLELHKLDFGFLVILEEHTQFVHLHNQQKGRILWRRVEIRKPRASNAINNSFRIKLSLLCFFPFEKKKKNQQILFWLVYRLSTGWRYAPNKRSWRQNAPVAYPLKVSVAPSRPLVGLSGQRRTLD